MISVILFLLSIGLQLSAAVSALLLIRITGRKLAWILLSVAMLLMAWRRIVSFGAMLAAGKTITFEFPEYIALIISALMLTGVLRIGAYFRSIQIAGEKSKKAEEELSKSEWKFRNLFNNSEVGMFRTRLDGSEILDANEKFLNIFGRAREEVIGKPSVIHWADPREREEMVKRLKEHGRVSDFECRMLNKKGEALHCIALHLWCYTLSRGYWKGPSRTSPTARS